MNDDLLHQIRDLIQQDVNNRGLQTDPSWNLINACPDDFAAACRSIAETPKPNIAVVTGFYIPDGQPPGGETDGPLGALFLARAFAPLDFPVVIAAESYCISALRAGLEKCGLQDRVRLYELATSLTDYRRYLQDFFAASGNSPFTHLIAVERAGPSHNLVSLQSQLGLDSSMTDTYLEFTREMPASRQNRCHTMRGIDITAHTSPAHFLFETANSPHLSMTTIGIGDGGNEIGMGRIPWTVIRRNITYGGSFACRVPTHHLIVAGCSNWGAYGLAAGVRLLRDARDPELLQLPMEAQLLRHMVEHGPLVDGVTGRQQTTVDGLAFDKYGRVLLRLGEMMKS